MRNFSVPASYMKITSRFRRSGKQGSSKRISTAALAFGMILHLSILVVPSVVHADGRRKAVGTIAVFLPHQRYFDQALKGLRQELDGILAVEHFYIDDASPANFVTERIRSIEPQLAVLMDTKAVQLFRSYREQLSGGDRGIPAVVLMVPLLQQLVADMPNVVGIDYAVPGVTSLRGLRSIMKTPLKRVGVVYREIMGRFIEEERRLCLREGIELLGIQIAHRETFTLQYLREALTGIELEGIDALLVLNDSILLNKNSFSTVWIPFSARFKKPIVVGARNLAEPDLRFGTLAVLPDHVSLGVQAAETVLEIRDSGWTPAQLEKVERPVSIEKVLNLRASRGQLNTTPDLLMEFDEVRR